MKNNFSSATLLYFFILFFTIVSCDDSNEEFEYPGFITPQLIIIDAVEINSNEFVLNYKVYKGQSVTLNNLYIEFSDLTDTTATKIKINLNFKDKTEYEDTCLISIPVKEHDYRITIKSESKKNVFSSNKQIIHFTPDYNNSLQLIKYVDIYKYPWHYFFLNPDENISNAVTTDENIGLEIYYNVAPPADWIYKIKVGDYIFQIDRPYVSTGFYNSHECWFFTLPSNFPPGDYEVSLIANNKEYKSISKIRVLPNLLTKRTFDSFNVCADSGHLLINTCFLSGSKLYYVCETNHDVLVYDLTTQNWEMRKTLTFPVIFHSYLCSFDWNNVLINGKKYFMQTKVYVNYDRTPPLLTEYNEATDSWTEISEYPGEGYRYFIMFSYKNTLMTGTYENSDFWIYNFETGLWVQKNNIPKDKINKQFISSCQSETCGYAFTNFRELWKYDFSSDNWTKISQLKGGPYNRLGRIIYGNNKIYLVGGSAFYEINNETLSDVWEYDIQKDEWKLLSLNCYASENSPLFFYNNQLISGYKTKPIDYFNYVKYFDFLNLN